MTQRDFIKVVGFTDVERHALNTVFRLSEQEAGRTVGYALWTPEAPQGAGLALLDADSWQAQLESQACENAHVPYVWVGPDAPAATWRIFQRPLLWTEVVQAMDQLFATDLLDFDLAVDEEAGPDTQPPLPESPTRRALIASADRDERLYLRAKLALLQIALADEAETAEAALALLGSQAYEVVLLDFGLPGAQGWDFVRQLTALQPPGARVIVTKSGVTWMERLRARSAGVHAFFDKPPHPVKLAQVLLREA